jgi:serine/threonine-protein kinase RsbW
VDWLTYLGHPTHAIVFQSGPLIENMYPDVRYLARRALPFCIVTTIQLTVPADAIFVGLVRSTAAHTAAHANLDMDQIDDLRLAVDEAFALVIGTAGVAGNVSLSFTITQGGLEVSLTGPQGVEAPEHGTFAWTILSALVSDVESHVTDGQVTITLNSKAGASA